MSFKRSCALKTESDCTHPPIFDKTNIIYLSVCQHFLPLFDIVSISLFFWPRSMLVLAKSQRTLPALSPTEGFNQSQYLSQIVSVITEHHVCGYRYTAVQN